jgi:hypothetical protein
MEALLGLARAWGALMALKLIKHTQSPPLDFMLQSAIT